MRDVTIMLGIVTDPNAADPNDNGASALHKAIKAEATSKGYGLSAEELYKADADAQYNKQLTVEVLIEHPGVNLNMKMSTDGRTALHLAAQADAEALAIIAILLNKGARVDITDNNGFTPLHISAAHGSFAAVTHLTMAAAEQSVLSEVVNGATLIREHTPLHMAARGSSRGQQHLYCLPIDLVLSIDGCTRSMCCEALIDARADPTTAGRLGETPLHVAARWGDPDLCKVRQPVCCIRLLSQCAAGPSSTWGECESSYSRQPYYSVTSGSRGARSSQLSLSRNSRWLQKRSRQQHLHRV